MAKMQCPRCKVVYGVQGNLPKNPGGMGAEPGWSCLFCVIDPPFKTKVKFAKLWRLPSWACVWVPIYLIPYEGSSEPTFTLTEFNDDQGFVQGCARN